MVSGDNFSVRGKRFMLHKMVARALTQAQRELLIEHVDGSSSVEVAIVVSDRNAARKILLSKGLIRPDRHRPPKVTTITDDGRQVLAYVLAEYADALVRAGCVGIATPLEAKPSVPLAPDVEPELVEPA